MTHLFILNSFAGTKDSTPELKAAIEADPNFLGAVRRNYERLKAEQAGDVGGSTNERADEDQVSLFDNEGN